MFTGMLLRLFVPGVLIFFFSINLFAQQQASYSIKPRENSAYYQRLFADSSFLQLKNSLGHAMQEENELAAAQCLKQMGHICYHMGYYTQALEYHLQADKIFNKKNKALLRAENLDEIGMVFMQNDQLALARQQYDEALSIYRLSKHDPGMAITYGKIGHLFIKLHLYDSAFLYERRSLNYYMSVRDDEGMARVYGEIGNIYEDMQKYDSSFYYTSRYVSLSEQTRDTTACIEGLNNLGDILRKTGRYTEALILTRRAILLSRLTREEFHLINSYEDIAKTHHQMKNNDSAYYYLRAARQQAEKIYSRETGTQLAMLKTIYEVEKKNVEIMKLKAGRRITVSLVIIGLLMLIIGGLIISRQRLKIKNARLLNEQERNIYESQRSIMELQKQTLKQELEVKSRDLGTHTLHIIQKNQFLENLYRQLDEMLKDDRRDQKKQIKQLQLQINQNFNHEKQWDEFHGIFDEVNHEFFKKLKTRCDNLTRSDLRLVALLKMNLPSTDIATLLGISQDSLRVVRYRLRKKLGLQKGESLTMFIQSL